MDLFGHTADGRRVDLVTIDGGGLVAEVLTLGATIRSLRLEGWPHPLTLGFDTVAEYGHVRGHIGVVAGRYANRITDGRFPLDGRDVQLAVNEGTTMLHGGPDGFAYRVWQIGEHARGHVRLELVSPDGDQGFPGELRASVTYSLGSDATLDMVFEAESDAPTLANLTQHTYFNLKGGGTIDGHTLEVAASTYLPVDDASLPTAGPTPVAGTAFELATPSLLAGRKLDHNYCLASCRRPAPEPAATLGVPGLTMRLATTEPGLQVYTGDKLQRGPAPRRGLCLEPQVWPDAPNHPAFPSAVLRPGERYRHQTRLTFERS